MKKLPNLETERLILQPFALVDGPRVQELAGSKDVSATTSAIPHPYPSGLAEAWIQGHQKAYEEDQELNLKIRLKESNDLIGAIGLVIKRPHQRASLGYWLGKAYWNQGYCTEAAREVLRFGFAELGLHKIYATHYLNNPASGKVMKKIGMTKEGILKEHLVKSGEFHDLVYYGILKTEYERM